MEGPADAAEGGPADRLRVVIQKFGGTSLADAQGRAACADRVAEAMVEGFSPVVVVSAMGRRGHAYATDTLLGLIEGPPDDRESDMLASCGEIVSAVVFGHELRARGIDAVAMTGPQAGLVTDGRFGDAAVLAVDTGPIREMLSCGKVPVIAGFQGQGPDGSVTTLGRGGSDTTACALGAALLADSVEVFKDVDGVMTADPRVCPDASFLEGIEYREMFEMARTGARIVHSAAAEMAEVRKVPLRVRATAGGSAGTVVGVAVERSKDQVATAVSSVEGIARLTIAAPEGDAAWKARTFKLLADEGLSLDMFTPVPGGLVFSLPDALLPRALAVLDAAGLVHSEERGLAMVTLVGSGMHGVPGVMARVAGALASEGIDFLQSADSHTTISVLVWQNRGAEAVRALHREFGLHKER